MTIPNPRRRSLIKTRHHSSQRVSWIRYCFINLDIDIDDEGHHGE